MALNKGQHNSGIKNLKSFKKGKSGYTFVKRIVKCVCCGIEFKTTGPRALYCSNKCKEKSRPDGQKKLFTCEFCGKEFKRRATNNMGRFCSRLCSGLWMIANGECNYFYKAFLYLPHKCDICNNDEFEVLLVHHKDISRTNHDIKNLQILCANCHYKIHFGNGSVRHKKIKPILEFLKRNELSEISGQLNRQGILDS